MKRALLPLFPLVLVSAAAIGCPASKPPPPVAPAASSASASASTSTEAATTSTASSASNASAIATPTASASASVATRSALQSPPIGAPAPDFALPDLEGKTVKLSDFKGKVVVLEWFNPGCPFVKIAHEKRGLSKTAAKYAAKGVVFLAINSGAPGKQGNPLPENVKVKKAYGIGYPILRDEQGTVGRQYGATNTPHMFVVAKDGTLAYSGGLDDTLGGEVDKGEKVTPWLVNAIDATLAGKRAEPAQTKAWGCHVKYAD